MIKLKKKKGIHLNRKKKRKEIKSHTMNQTIINSNDKLKNCNSINSIKNNDNKQENNNDIDNKKVQQQQQNEKDKKGDDKLRAEIKNTNNNKVKYQYILLVSKLRGLQSILFTFFMIEIKINFLSKCTNH